MNLFEKYKDLKEDELNSEFLDACSSGNLEVVKYVLTSSELKYHADINCESGLSLYNACEAGHLEIVKFLLTGKNLSQKYDMGFDSNMDEDERDAPFRVACSNGHFPIIKYLLTSPELEQHYPLENKNDSAISDASYAGRIDVIKYLTSSPDLNTHLSLTECAEKGFYMACLNNQDETIKFFFDYCEKNHLSPNKIGLTDGLKSLAGNIHCDSLKMLVSLMVSSTNFVKRLPYNKKRVDYINDALGSAAASGNLEVVKYLLTSPELPEHGSTSIAVNRASFTKQFEVLQYLIFELNAPKDKEVKDFLNNYPNPVVENMFQARELNQNLHEQLSYKTVSKKLKKI
jgi:ankyrin repeat protein